jgi:hypothetical protein
MMIAAKLAKNNYQTEMTAYEIYHLTISPDFKTEPCVMDIHYRN